MRIKIKNKIYDTDKSQELARRTNGVFGDPAGYEEILYRKAVLTFFILGRGGAESLYPEEMIVPIDIDTAQAFLKETVGVGIMTQILQADSVKSEKKKETKAKTVKSKTTKTATKTKTESTKKR